MVIMSRSEAISRNDMDRDSKMKKWHLRKELFEKGQELFSQINQNRAEEEESLKEVAIAAAAIDRMLSDDEPVEKESRQKAGGKQKTMKSIWTKWTMENHSFSMIPLSEEDIRPYSAAVKEMLEKEGDHYILLSLKYNFPGVPKPGEKAKPITNDQRLQNLVFMKECAKVWKAAKEELRLRVLEYVSRAQMRSQSHRRKSRDAEDEESIAMAAERACLTNLSIRRLKQWVEDDEDARAEALREEKQEKIAMSKQSHEQFVRHKDSLRIRLPPSNFDPAVAVGAKVRPKSAGSARMSFGQGVRKKEDIGPQTTVELMAGSGLKYVHATGKGRQGMEGDLEKSRKLLVSKGFIDRENFDQDPESDFNPEAFKKMVMNNPTVLELKKQREREVEESAKAFDEWSSLKANRELAVKYLALVPPPTMEINTDPSVSFDQPAVAPHCTLTRESLDDCVEIGQLLKKVDRTLFPEWFKWANSDPAALKVAKNSGAAQKGISFNFATAMWDYFEPRACDVHSAITSQVRDTFLKLLRPGLDFRAAFHAHAEKLWNRKKARTDYDLDEEEKAKMIACIALGRKDMQNLLVDMGVSMKKNEVNALIDAFDSNGDGVVTMAEFLEFTGPAKHKNSGVSTTLKKVCCWRTTCIKTGMPNAYVMSEPTKEQLRREGKNVIDDNASDAGASKVVKRGTVNEKSEIIRLKNGETRVRVELAERKRREDLLRRYHVLNNDEPAKRRAKETEHDEYSDDDEDEGYGSDFDQEHGDGGASGKEKDDACAYSSWSMEERQMALKKLGSITKNARQEEMLKAMIADGKPPSTPRLWAAPLADDEVDDAEDSLTTSLLIRWSPGDAANDLVSFYSVEFAGLVKTVATGERVYKEVFRDPPDADINARFDLKFWIENLEPGCSYAFRIRAFNGYGPSPFGYQIFSTRPAAPALPKVINLAHDAVTLRWVFSNTFMYQMKQLKQLFEMADNDGSGEVSREELGLIFSDVAQSNPDLMKMVKKVLIKKGINPDQGVAGLFDQIEGDDDNALSWDEFEKFFVSAGFTNDSMGASRFAASKGPDANMYASLRESKKLSSDAKSGSNISYVVEQCENEFESKYKECMKSSNGVATIARLEPGHTYRFRVHGVNVDGIAGPNSESIIVHTMLETPPAPTVVGSGTYPPGVSDKVLFNPSLQPNKVVLRWRGRREGLSSRDKGVVNRILGDWAGTSNEDSGVSVEKAFAEYDRDRNGTIEPSEFAYLLSDLGVEVTEERLTAAFTEFDADADGVISYSEFCKWWRRDDVSYILKRSELIPPALPVSLGTGTDTEQSKIRSTMLDKSTMNKSQRSKTPMRVSRAMKAATTSTNGDPANVENTKFIALPIVSYRGSGKGTEVSGLDPNSLYHFHLRYIGSRCNSALSPPLVVMTTPLACETPVLIYLAPNQVRIKWYPPSFGAHKFCVQLKNLTPSGPDAKKKEDYTVVYLGQDTTWVSTTLVPDSSYSVRVVGVNHQGALGVPSSPLSFRTYPRGDTQHLFTPKGAGSTFTIECTGDVCVGDTILLTERLYAKPRGVGAVYETSGGVRTSDNESFTSRNMAMRSSKPIGLKRGKGGGVESGTSVYSLASTGRGGHLVTGDAPEAGAFIGERTLAAHVVADNYKSTRVELGLKELQAGRFSKTRRLWLEVVWQKTSNDACKPYDLKPGVVVERTQAHIEQFEVFRCPWVSEDCRKSLREDLSNLTECFLSYKC